MTIEPQNQECKDAVAGWLRKNGYRIGRRRLHVVRRVVTLALTPVDALKLVALAENRAHPSPWRIRNQDKGKEAWYLDSRRARWAEDVARGRSYLTSLTLGWDVT